MPFDPNSPLTPAGADGIEDWFVPGQSPGRIAPWTPQTDHFFPDDWISPDNWNVPTPPAAPSTALPPPPSPQPNATNPAISNRPAPPPDPFAAYWALIPASRAGAMAWQPPFFPSSNPLSLQNIPASPWVTPPPLFPNLLRQFPWTAPAPTNIPSDSAPNGLLGGIARMLAASAPRDVPPIAAGQGLLGGLASLQPAAWNTQAGASYLPDSRALLSPDPTGYQRSGPSYAYLRNDLLNGADPTGPAQPPNDGNFEVAPDTGQENAGANIHLVAGEEGEKEHDKLDPAVFTGLTDKGLTDSPKALPTLPPLLPIFPRPLLPPTSAPQPPPRASLPPPSSPPPGALPPASPGQAAASPRPANTSVGPAPAALSESGAGGRGGGSGDGTSSAYGESGGSVEPNITKPYSRPSNATNRLQRTSVQGQPCVNCGVVHPRMYANHIEPLVQQYYRTGTIDTAQMRSLNAVNAQCPTCSARQGGFMANFSKFMKNLLGL
jgi:hypothetical protein